MEENIELVAPGFRCPNCGEREMDNLVWIEDDVVVCQTCGHEYDPGATPDAA